MIGFGFSLVVGVVTETRRLIGGALLTSVVLGTHHRPVCQHLIVMSLDIANSTRLAETMGELRVHDLITRFFFEPISDHGGAVHAHVGDEVIVSWPVSADPARNARRVLRFSVIERKMARVAADHRREFRVSRRAARRSRHCQRVRTANASSHISATTMNVAARLCEHWKAVDRQLVVSGDLLRLIAIPADFAVGEGKALRWAAGGSRSQRM